jgi:citrate lyase beta subunit
MRSPTLERVLQKDAAHRAQEAQSDLWKELDESAVRARVYREEFSAWKQEMLRRSGGTQVTVPASEAARLAEDIKNLLKGL